jgi:hypothetical protein
MRLRPFLILLTRRLLVIGGLIGITFGLFLGGTRLHFVSHEDLNFVHPLNVTPGGPYNDATLQAAIKAIGSGQQTLIIPPGTWTIANPLTIPANVHVWIAAGAQFAVESGQSLTINGPFFAPLLQVFNGTGRVVFGRGVMGLYPQWWGAHCDNEADDTSPLQRTLDTAVTGQHPVLLSDNTFCRITGPLRLKPGVDLVGRGRKSSNIIVVGQGVRGLVFESEQLTDLSIMLTGFNLAGASTAVGDLLVFTNASQVALQHLRLAVTGGSALTVTSSYHVALRDVHIEAYTAHGAHFNASNVWSLDNVAIVSGYVAGQNALFIQNSGWGHVVHSDLEGNHTGLHGLRLEGARNVHFLNNYIELFVTRAIVASTTASVEVTFEGNHINANAGPLVDFSGTLQHARLRLESNVCVGFGNRLGPAVTQCFDPGATQTFRYVFNSLGGSTMTTHVMGYTADSIVKSHSVQIGDSTLNGGHLILDNHHLWIDGAGRLRIKKGTPKHDTDGAVVGNQS